MSRVNATNVERVCDNCGKTFLAAAHEVRRGNVRYCSCACYHASRRIPIEVQFWRSVGPANEHGCLPWTGLIDHTGRGVIYSTLRPPQRIFIASRIAWEIQCGSIPDGLCVLHNCPGGDNPLCVNVEHLFLGTQLDNISDMVAKGRQHKGEGVGSAKVTAEIVRSIRRRYAAGGISQTRLGEEYGLHNVTVSCIIRRKTWKHID